MSVEFELVLPCYNESRSLEKLIQRAVSAALESQMTPESFQLVLVENGSQDDSAHVLKTLASSPLGKWFRVVSVEVNRGYGNGIACGLRATHAPVVGWSHADEQCDPKDAFRAFDIVLKDPNPRIFVKGVRSGRNRMDRLVTCVFEIFAKVLLALPVSEINAQPKVFRRALLREIPDPPLTFAFDLYVLFRASKAGYQFKTIPVVFHRRAHGISNWAFSFMGRYRTILGMIQYMWRLRRSEGAL